VAKAENIYMFQARQIIAICVAKILTFYLRLVKLSL